jgi:hypothetical protein
MTRDETFDTLHGLAMLLENAWEGDGLPVTLTLRAEVLNRCRDALERVLLIRDRVPVEAWPEEEEDA